MGASTELFGDETTNQDSLEPEVGELDSLLEDWGVPIRNSGVVAEAVVTDLNRHHTKLLSIKGYRNACIYPSIIKKLLSQKTTSGIVRDLREEQPSHGTIEFRASWQPHNIFF